jgi:hypothetical protein
VKAHDTELVTVPLGHILEEFDERLGSRREPEILTLTEKQGFIPQRLRFNKRLAIADTSNYKLIGLHDIAFNPYLLWAGAVAQNTEWESAIISPLYPTFRVRRGHDPRFVNYVLHSGPLRSRYDGISFGSVPRKRRAAIPDFLNLRIPQPPSLPEQQRIAEMLDRAEALRARRRAALAQLETLTQALFFDLFGIEAQTPVTVGDKLQRHRLGWRWELLTDVARLATGHTPDRKRPDYWNGDIPWITLTEIRRLDGTTAAATSEMVSQAGIDHSAAVRLPAGTVCFSRTASIGFVTVMGREMATSQDFVNWVCGPSLEPLYLMHALLRSRERLRALSTGSTHKTIYFPTVEQFRVLVPPIDLQRSFARRLGSVEKLRSAFRASLAELEALFASLQHRAFRGEL